MWLHKRIQIDYLNINIYLIQYYELCEDLRIQAKCSLKLCSRNAQGHTAIKLLNDFKGTVQSLE